MGNKFIIDEEEVKKAVEDLQGLLDDCEESYLKPLPYSEYAIGYTYDKLINLCTATQDTMYSLGTLVEKTITFLSGTSSMFAKIDRTNAEAMKRRSSTDADSVDYKDVAAKKAGK